MADNFKDGYLIGTAYLTGIPVGLATTISIIAHEPFLELAGFSVQVRAGFSPAAAVMLNLTSAMVALVGTLIVLALGTWMPSLPHYLTPVGAGLALYLSFQLLRMIQVESKLSKAFGQALLFLIGFGALVLAKYIEGWLGA
jgi:zinc and cadmium transporter